MPLGFERSFALTGDSVSELRGRLERETNFGGTAVHGIGWYVADRLPSDITDNELPRVAEELASQIGCLPIAASIIRMCGERKSDQGTTAN